ncbi:hypothetical protein Sango_1055100 [Sesamum angolense]|uniref:Uncharacterized protein n=1 Tax=Sesamum angolense TaxID=2727404 RepID=A0AAE2BZ69_9LAMI|nr:hypothetical protein Sango_1055100 [Sesamum angolense]
MMNAKIDVGGGLRDVTEIERDRSPPTCWGYAIFKACSYVLSGWEGSAADGRVLRDAVHRPVGVKVPTGNYYLCDNGYGNVEGFLTPYRVLGELPDEVDMSVDHRIEVVSTLDATPQWTSWSDALATDMAEPHINSKIHVWKKHYGTLMGMMGKSGFGWDDSRSMITVDSQDVWDEYCKIDSNARTMRYKSWPFFLAWREIFDKDRVIGEVIVEAHPKVNKADTDADTEMHGYYIPIAEWCPGVGYVENNSGALGDIQGNVDHAVNTFCDTANQRLSEISKKLFVDYEEVEKCSAVFATGGSIPGIDLNEQILISDRLVENPKKMDLFFSLPDDARARMVGLMLSGKV